jgi:hypothetical protein
MWVNQRGRIQQQVTKRVDVWFGMVVAVVVVGTTTEPTSPI